MVFDELRKENKDKIIKRLGLKRIGLLKRRKRKRCSLFK